MYPNQPQVPPPPLPQPGGDYLNQIAPQVHRRPLFQLGPKLFVFIGLILVVVVIAFVIIVNAVNASRKEPLERLSARLTSTQTIVTSAQPHIKSSKLRAINSNLALYLTNTQRNFAKPLLAAGITTAKLNPDTKKQEATTALASRLEDARLNAVYDRTYAREMTYKLSTILSLLEQIYASNYGTSIKEAAPTSTSCASDLTACTKEVTTMKEFISDAYVNLTPTQKAFADYDASNS